LYKISKNEVYDESLEELEREDEMDGEKDYE
jgi:hypothetical protein